MEGAGSKVAGLKREAFWLKLTAMFTISHVQNTKKDCGTMRHDATFALVHFQPLFHPLCLYDALFLVLLAQIFWCKSQATLFFSSGPKSFKYILEQLSSTCDRNGSYCSWANVSKYMLTFSFLCIFLPLCPELCKGETEKVKQTGASRAADSSTGQSSCWRHFGGLDRANRRITGRLRPQSQRQLGPPGSLRT